jgi:nicotinamide-nucleotide amidase
MPDRNRVQALFPVGSEVIFNEMGTAPGIWMRINRAIFAAMPGVPSEMFVMFDKQIAPRLQKANPDGGVFVQRKINTFGDGESGIENKLLDLTKRGNVPEVGITVSDAIVSLRILASGKTQEEVDKLIAPVEATIRERLGDLVFSTEEVELQEVVVQMLIDSRKTLSVVEGVSGGAVMYRLCRVPGASQSFRGGLVAYQNSLKEGVLGLPSELVREHGIVSAQVAEELAKRCRIKFGTDLALSTVGIAGPSGGTPEKPVGTVYCAMSYEGGVDIKSHCWSGTRDEVINRTAKLALNLVRLHLLKKV